MSVFAIWSSVNKRGAWTVPPRLAVYVAWGSAELDLREAVLGPETTIDLGVVMGSVKILVPPHVTVESQLLSIASSVSDCERGASGPRIKLVGMLGAGSCEVCVG